MAELPSPPALVGIEGTVRHDPRLRSLLEKLAEIDSLFHHNVPAPVRESYDRQADNKALFDYLQRVYTQPEFVIEDPEVIKRVIQAGDKVRKKGEFKKVKWSVQPGEKGYLRTTGSDTAKVSFPSRLVEVKLRDLVVLGKEGFFSNTYFAQRTPALKYSSLEWGLLVEYQGETLEECTVRIPDGTLGIVWKDDRDYAPLQIAWERGPGVKAYHSREGRDYGHQLLYSGYQEIKLVRPNPVNFPALTKEYLGDQDGQ